MTFDLHKAIMLYNLKTKHQRYMKLYIFGILMTRRTICRYVKRNRSIFQFLTHVKLSRSMAAILEIIKKLLLLILNSVQSPTVLTFCAQWMCLAALLSFIHSFIKFYSIQIKNTITQITRALNEEVLKRP